MTIRCLSILLTIAFGVLLVSADSPLPPPKRHEVQSASGKYTATVDPKSGVVVRAHGSRKPLWKAKKIWSRNAFLADDGEHIATGYDGLNLIPIDYSTNLALVTFWRRDQKIGEVTVGELFPNTNTLVRTVSHYHWGSIRNITNTTLTVSRCDKKDVKFDMTTGKVIE